MAKEVRWYDLLFGFLLVVAGLNWGLDFLLDFNLVTWLAGLVGTWVEWVLYIPIVIAALWWLALLIDLARE